MEAIVEYNYVAKEPDELTLRKGDIIKDIKVMPGGWWEGTLKDKRGMFPDNFVKVIDASLTSATTSGLKSETEVNTIGKKEQVTMRNGSSGSRWCKVLFSYEPCNEDELTLVPNDMIEFLGEVEEGWWSGRIGGRIGVFPSNFVSPPTLEEPIKLKERERDTKKELCRVLFPYEAANEDELTLVEGDIITILSRDAPDKGWWKGELRGRIGLFPDNFVKVIVSEDESPTLDEAKSSGLKDANKTNLKSSTTKSSYTGKKVEKAFVRKSLDTRVSTPEKKSVATSSTSPITPSVSSLIINSEKKISVGSSNTSSIQSLSMSMNLKKTTKNTNDETNVDNTENVHGAVDEELDGIEREEYTPLLHLTATRVKAPRRRLPSSHCNRSQNNFNSYTNETLLQENNVTNGTTDTVDQPRDEESESLHGKTRQKAPWIKELKLNQMEKKKTLSGDKFDKSDVTLKKEKNYSHEQLSNVSEIYSDQNQDNDEIRVKEEDKDNSTYQRNNSSYLTCPVSPTTSPVGNAYVPYRLYNQLLDRVRLLEEQQLILQRTVAQLKENRSFIG